MGLKIVIEPESDESEEVECPKCGCECESGDKYCHDCGAKLTAEKSMMTKARVGALTKAMSEDDD